LACFDDAGRLIRYSTRILRVNPLYILSTPYLLLLIAYFSHLYFYLRLEMALKRTREPAEAAESTPKRPQRAPKPSQRLIESQLQLTPLSTQQINESIEIPEEPEPPIEVPQSTLSRSIEPLKQPGERSRRSSPRPILQAFRAAQHVNEQAWESQLVANKSAIATCRRPSAVVNLNCVTNRVVQGPRYKLSYDARTIQDNTHSS
jgi:hypothetical protein